MSKPSLITYELVLRFTDSDTRRAAGTKRAILATLAHLGIDQVVEGVIDGVEDAVDDGGDSTAQFQLDDTSPVAVFDDDEARLRALGERLAAAFPGHLALRHAQLATEAWSEAWALDQTELVTERFHVSSSATAPANSLALRLAPGTAFGDGRHATTSAALRCLERLADSHARDGVLDVGTGTGVLALAAARLGFLRLTGTEIDGEALAEAGANATLNGLPLRLLLTAALPADEPPYALIIANILVPVLHQLMPDFARRLAPGGSVILAGFIDKEAEPLIAAAAPHGLVPADRLTVRGWVGLRLVRKT